jgi:hypothetical protein
MKFRCFLSAIFFILLIGCAGTRSVQKVDGPEDYYETETPGSEIASPEKETKTNESQGDSKDKKFPQAIQQPSPSTPQKTKVETKEPDKNNQKKAPASPPPENNTPPVKVEEATIPDEIKEDMSDDSWGRDDSKSRIRKKDREKIKNSTPDDDKWGRE